MIESLFIACASVGLAVFLLNLVGASLYDIAETNRDKAYHAHPFALTYRRRPLVSIILSSENDETTVTASLESLMRSSYRNLEVIIVDHASTDATRTLIRQSQATHPKKAVRLVARRSANGRETAIQENVRRYAQGEYILRLDAASIIDKQAIVLAVRRLNSAPEIGRLELQRRTLANYSTAGLLQRYHELLHVSMHKSLSHYGIGTQTGLMPLMYRRQDGFSQKAAYAYDAIVYQMAVSYRDLVRQDYHQKLTGFQAAILLIRRTSSRLLRGLLTGIVLVSQLLLLLIAGFVGYFFYLAVHLHEPSFLLLVAAAGGLLLALAIWSDSRERLSQKLVYTLFLPVTFLVFYVLSLTRLIVLVRAAWEI
jgi:glycosyltransferase involved in cell wall biosynthesis